MKKGLLFIILITVMGQTHAQSKWGFENYNYWGHQTNSVFVPIIHLETNNSWYAEMRYNYEEAQTISFYAGKSFSGGNALSYKITPIGGFAAGRFTGLSLATNAEVDWKNFYISSQSQYSIAVKKDSRNFFFTWSELGYNISSKGFAGLALQYTRQLNDSETEPGFVVGLNIKNFSIPFYVFKPFNSGSYFVLGLNYEYNFKRKKNN